MQINRKMYNKLLKLEQNLALVSIRQGFLLIIPVFMSGAFSLMLLYFPIPAIGDFIRSAWNGNIAIILKLISESTFGLASVYLLIAVTYKYSSNVTRRYGIINVLSCITAIASYIALQGIKPEISVDRISSQVLLLSHLNVSNVFSAIVCSILSTRSFLFFHEKIKIIKDLTDFTIDMDFRTALRALFPMILTVSIFAVFSLILTALFGAANFNNLIKMLTVKLFEPLGRNIGSGLLILFLESLFWFFGIHGSNVFLSVNIAIFHDVPGELITQTFFDVFVLMGGCGTSICLVVSLFLYSNLKAQKSLGKCALLPLIFNINEIIVFGLPIVLNPVMFIPFILTPLVSLILSYGAMASGLVPVPQQSVAWTTPVFISGYLATGSIRGLLLQMFTIGAGVLIYAPFIKLDNKIHAQGADKLITEMSELVRDSLDKGKTPNLFGRNDYLSKAAKELAYELRLSIEKREIELFYQPQHDNSGRVVSCEALLRWKYSGMNYIFPPLILEIAKQDGCFEMLTNCIIDNAIRDTIAINGKFHKNICVSINIDSAQLGNLDFIKRVIHEVNSRGIIKNTFGIEITEETELKDNGHLSEAFEMLHKNNIQLAIDDFSTGYTSLVYLQTNKFDFVKLDGSLVRQLQQNERSIGIIKSIVDLGKSLDFAVIAEYVENEEIKNTLRNIGCSKYQGYFYSKPLKLQDFIEYVEEDWKKPPESEQKAKQKSLASI